MPRAENRAAESQAARVHREEGGVILIFKGISRVVFLPIFLYNLTLAFRGHLGHLLSPPIRSEASKEGRTDY